MLKTEHYWSSLQAMKTNNVGRISQFEFVCFVYGMHRREEKQQTFSTTRESPQKDNEEKEKRSSSLRNSLLTGRSIPGSNMQYVHQIATISEKNSIIVPAVPVDILKSAQAKYESALSSLSLGEGGVTTTTMTTMTTMTTKKTQIPSSSSSFSSSSHQQRPALFVGKIMTAEESQLYNLVSTSIGYIPRPLIPVQRDLDGRLVTSSMSTSSSTNNIALTSDLARLLHPFIPRCYGTHTHMGRTYTVLSDVCGEHEHPCICNIRLCGETGQDGGISARGMSVVGYRKYSAKSAEYQVLDWREETRKRQQLESMMEEFYAPSESELGLGMVLPQIERLQSLRDKLIRIIARADVVLGAEIDVLLTYDGEDRDVGGNVWMTDFDGFHVIQRGVVGDGAEVVKAAAAAEAADQKNEMLLENLNELIDVLKSIEIKLRKRAHSLLLNRITTCSNSYACRVLFELLDRNRKGAINYLDLLKRFSNDRLVTKTYMLIRKRWPLSKGKSEFSPKFLMSSFLKITSKAEGKKRSRGTLGGRSESPKNDVKMFTQEDFYEFMFAKE